uniref:Uncharacterized protein n=1 Tax=Corvus moneduloides TaxID=1196302 RepID=A0A8C3EA71_CORMO
MKCPGHIESSQLAFFLENALAREARIWKVYLRKLQDSMASLYNSNSFSWLFL